MTGDVKVSRRGVYYDLSISPYEYKSPYGDMFKFSSQKKLDMYSRDVVKEIKRVDTFFARHELLKLIPDEIVELVKRGVYKSFYKQVER